MFSDDALNGGEADTGSLKVLGTVEALEAIARQRAAPADSESPR